MQVGEKNQSMVYTKAQVALRMNKGKEDHRKRGTVGIVQQRRRARDEKEKKACQAEKRARVVMIRSEHTHVSTSTHHTIESYKPRRNK